MTEEAITFTGFGLAPIKNEASITIFDTGDYLYKYPQLARFLNDNSYEVAEVKLDILRLISDYELLKAKPCTLLEKLKRRLKNVCFRRD